MNQPERHPSSVELDQFVRNELQPVQALTIQRHLLLCERCEEVYLERFFEASPGTGPPPRELEDDRSGYTDAIERVLLRARDELVSRNRVLSDEQEEARHDLRRWLGQEADERLRRFEGDADITWGLCLQLIEECRRLLQEDLERAIQVGELSVHATRQLDERRYGRGRVQDLRARAWMSLGNVRRLSSDNSGAVRAFRNAEGHLARGSGDPGEEARLLELKSALARSERRFEESLRLIDEAIDLFELLTERHASGRALIRRGVILGFLDRLPEAVDDLRRGLALIDPELEPAIDLYGRHNLFCFLLDESRLLEAQAMLAETRRLHHEVGDASTRLQLRWLEGRLAADLGRLDDAREIFIAVRDGYLEAGVGLNAALVSLELAQVYLRRDQRDELAALATDMFALIRMRDVPRDAISAMVQFQEAAQSGGLTAEVIEQVSRAVRGGLVRPAALHRSPLPSQLSSPSPPSP